MNSINPLKSTLEAGRQFEATPLFEMKNRNLFLISKRIQDVCFSLLGLLLLSPLLLLIALLIKAEDPKGAVIFAQTRVGKNGKVFKMYKFRSMVSDAETMLGKLMDQNEIRGAMFKMRNDPRITRVGRFIRKTSLDELPQLLNVLMGNMSLVGPRPPLPREVDDYTSYDMMRLLVVPGCTGLWQISGRNHVGFQEMVELDLEYIRNQSLMKDIIIMFKTVKVLFGADNAY
ncbi:exopolysaccharide biosynthesis polyprenyl glycosylphosphotransferase [Paenibacillus dokdonensis]|uniref:Exopolysaccharide biosynthesis polyprenyl glycosylphosphotransferase n=1 Tax=Paenibacillus dokdonensis TaxID=2567944 RepID=A0ABU6GKM8_9BACL|nr:exopolysaccharide biosynthesis polyprenyl glycosylphosphotransferase [Paenibacillus dokdonensis]MEC0239275.1 exopolysaccharide biosynthesis polyprenyl glycosylphosphotransferase [Paenibacillus dokdonensis]